MSGFEIDPDNRLPDDLRGAVAEHIWAGGAVHDSFVDAEGRVHVGGAVRGRVDPSLPVAVARLVPDSPPVVEVVQPGVPFRWVMTPDYAEALAWTILGRAWEAANGPEEDRT